jgi:hypothetical protein
MVLVVSQTHYAITGLGTATSISTAVGTISITKTPEGVVLKTPNYFMLCAKEVEELVVKNDLITTNVLGFLNSSHFVKVTGRNGNEQILFINKRDLPDKKVIIFSATANEKIYKMVFGQNMKFYPIAGK